MQTVEPILNRCFAMNHSAMSVPLRFEASDGPILYFGPMIQDALLSGVLESCKSYDKVIKLKPSLRVHCIY